MKKRTGLISLIAVSFVSVLSGSTYDARLVAVPLHFEPNRGQAPPELRYIAKAKGFAFGITGSEALFSSGIRLRWKSMAQEIVAEAPLGGHSNYIEGNDPAKWLFRVPHFTRIRARQIEPGIDIVFYGGSGDARKLEYDLEVAPGANPAKIRLQFDGAKSLHLDPATGDLLIDTSSGILRQHKPVIHQGQGQRPVTGSYRLTASNEIAFQIGSYDHSRPLVIDPVLTWSTYLGGSSSDYAKAVAVDASGNVYVTGSTLSTNFPTASGIDSSGSGSTDAFVTKINAAGTQLVFSTYFGGYGADVANAIAVDAAGSAYVAGVTSSPNFPVSTPYQGSYAGGASDGFAAKFSATGALLYSTFLGGPGVDLARAIAVDTSGNAYVTGSAQLGFPVTATPFQPDFIAVLSSGFVVKLAPSGAAAAFATYLGGTAAEYPNAIAVDATGVYIAGSTFSNNFPSKGPIQPCRAGQHAFLSKLTPGGDSLIYSTCLGGSGNDSANALDIDTTGAAYLAGSTTSADFPLLGSNQYALNTNGSVFVSKVNPDGSALVYSTYLGGNTVEQANALRVDNFGRAYIAGTTRSINFPTIGNPLQASLKGYSNGFLSQLNAAGILEFSTYLGGSGIEDFTGLALDSSYSVYLTGTTQSADFPVVSPLFHSWNQVGTSFAPDAFIAKISSGASAASVTISSIPSGLNLIVDGNPVATPRAFSWQIGSSHTLDAPSNILNSAAYTFASWSNGGAKTQTVVATPGAAAYTATYVSQGCNYSLTLDAAAVSNAGTRGTAQVVTQPGCAWSPSYDVSWLHTLSQTYNDSNAQSGSGLFLYSADPNSSLTTRTGNITVGNAAQSLTERSDPPSVNFSTSVFPPSGLTATMNFSFNTGDGGPLTIGNVLINRFLDGRQACYMALDMQNRALFLVNDDGVTLSFAALRESSPGNYALAADLANSNCTVKGAFTTYSTTGAFRPVITFSPGFAGNKVVYTAARSATSNSGWIASGVWEVPQTSPPLPRNIATSVTAGASKNQFVISAIYRDASSSRNLSPSQLLIQNFVDGRSACYLAYDHIDNNLYLMNDAGSTLLPTSIKPGTFSGTLDNSQCTVNASGVTVVESGTDFTLNLNVTFKSSFAGAKIIYSGVQTITGGNSDWQAVAGLTVQ